MKNVLFTTTAVAALALGGAAFADGHQTTSFNISGSSNVGYNNSDDSTDDEGGLFLENDVDLKVNHAVGDGYNLTASFGIDMEASQTSAGGSNLDDDFKFEGAKLTTPAGSLSWDDDMDGATAADEFYTDLEGMAIDIPDADGDSGIKWVGDFGDFGYAISTGDSTTAADGDGDIPTNFTIGSGGSFGDVTIGLGYAEGAGADEDTMGVSAGFGVGGLDLKVAFIDRMDTSIGVQGSYAVNDDITVGAWFASNDGAADDSYGVMFDMTSGAFTVGIDFEIGEEDELEVDLAYAVNDDITLRAGYDQGETNVDGDEGAIYVGLEASVTDYVSATLSWSDAHEIGAPEYKVGTSAFLTVKY